jgi:flagellar hook-associated protein 1
MGLSIYSTLFVARKGLMAQQVGLSVTGQNITNVNTEGYTRRQAVLTASPDSGGVDVAGFRRYVDEFSNRRLVAEKSVLGFSEQRSSILSQVGELFNDLENTGLGTALDDFFGGLTLLESSPDDLTVRQQALAFGANVASTFNRISSDLTEVKRGIDDLLRASVSEINQCSDQIASLNKDIRLGVANGDDVSDLEDSRDRLISQMSEQADITYVEGDDHQITVYLEGGMPLVDGTNVSHLSVSTSAAPGAAPIEYISSNGTVSDITAMIKDGALGGALQARDDEIPAYLQELDQLAYDFATAVNAQHSAGYGLDGVGGRNFFEPLASPINAAAAIAISADVDGDPYAIAAAGDPAGAPGDNTNAIALSELSDQLLAYGGTMTVAEAYSTLVGEVGVAIQTAADSVAMRETSISSIESIRDSQAGVALDEELTNMIAFQRAYQASARVVSTVDTLLQTILGMGA